MPDRLTEYLERCLSGVPRSRYRLRLREELEGHLADLTEGYLARGCGETEAEERAMEKLGSPERLREEFREAWRRQPERWRRDLGRLMLGCCLAAAGRLLGTFFLEWFGAAADAPAGARRILRVAGDPRWRLFASSVLFAGQTLPCLLFLRWRFRRESTRRAWVTAGLALAWGLDKALLLLDAGLRGFPSVGWLLGTLGAVLLLGLVFS